MYYNEVAEAEFEIYDTKTTLDVCNDQANPNASNVTSAVYASKKYKMANTVNDDGVVPVTEVSSTVAVKGVTLSETAKTLDVDDTFTLTAKVAPDNATDTSVTWESSAPTVAKVEGGVVTALAPGKATITVKTVDGGFTATCDVTVNEPAKAKVVIRNPHGGALDVNAPADYQFSGSDGDAVAFIADVTPVGDNTVSKLTWTITSGEKTRDDIVQTLNGAVSGSSISYGLIVTGINAVSAVNAVAE